MANQITLPWPERGLWRNYYEGKHWSVKSTARKKAKELAYILARTSGIPTAPNAQAVHINIVFHQPDYKKRDEDNMKSTTKGGLDGLALWMGCDDSVFKLTEEFPEERKKGGQVVIQIKEITGV